MAEQARSRALDSWNYAAPFARFHIEWSAGDIVPAFEQDQAVAIVTQELRLAEEMDVWAQRAVLVTFSSEHVAVNGRPAQREPAWVVMLAGVKREDPAAGQVVQVLLHARSGEVLLGTTVPVHLRTNP